MDEERKRAYSEVIEVLKMIEDEERLTKIPFEVIEMIKNNSDPTYKPSLSRELPLDEQNLSEQTYGILGWIADKYWGENLLEEDKSANTEEIKNNEEKEDSKEIKEVNVYSDIDPETIDKTLLPTVIIKPNLFKKIIEKITKFFKSIFKGVYE